MPHESGSAAGSTQAIQSSGTKAAAAACGPRSPTAPPQSSCRFAPTNGRACPTTLVGARRRRRTSEATLRRRSRRTPRSKAYTIWCACAPSRGRTSWCRGHRWDGCAAHKCHEQTDPKCLECHREPGRTWEPGTQNPQGVDMTPQDRDTLGGPRPQRTLPKTQGLKSSRVKTTRRLNNGHGDCQGRRSSHTSYGMVDPRSSRRTRCIRPAERSSGHIEGPSNTGAAEHQNKSGKPPDI